MIYVIIWLVLTAFIFINVLGSFAGIRNIPEGEYKDALWKFKKMEIAEKAVVCLIFGLVILSMRFSEQINVTLVSLGACFAILAMENALGKKLRRELVCPRCGAPVWLGNVFVVLRPRHTCNFCLYSFVGKNDEADEEEDEGEDAASEDAATEPEAGADADSTPEKAVTPDTEPADAATDGADVPETDDADHA